MALVWYIPKFVNNAWKLWPQLMAYGMAASHAGSIKTPDKIFMNFIHVWLSADFRDGLNMAPYQKTELSSGSVGHR
jgi:hypothetical protein